MISNLHGITLSSMENYVVVMGVAGCGKSSLAKALANAQGWHLIEGDEFHSDASREKMSHGIALTDEDRAGWLDILGTEMQKCPHGVVLTCSALKKAYRDVLRAAVPDLRFVFLDIDRTEAQRRVMARAASHFFSASLVDNQFTTLESPIGESGVLLLNATDEPEALRLQVMRWLHTLR